MKTIFEESGGTYSKVGDYYLPNLLAPSQTEDANFGYYGRMRKDFLKRHHKSLYHSMLIEGTLNQHLNQTDKSAKEALGRLTREMIAALGINEQLKSDDQMAWVGAVNNIKSAVMEIVLAEIIYA